LIGIAEKVEERLEGLDKNIKSGNYGLCRKRPGEAKEADIGIAGGKGEVLLFKKGVIVVRSPRKGQWKNLWRKY